MGRPLLFLALCVAGAALFLALRRSAERPNVLLITLDTTRSDAIGEATPNLFALASRGATFPAARTPVPLTLPAHLSILSGMDPPRHGIRDNASPPLPRERGFPLLAEEMRDAGYATAAFVASSVLDPRFGLDAGFSRYDHPPVAAPGAVRFEEIACEEQVRRAKAWLATRPKERPFLVWVHFFDPHEPYEAWPGHTDDADPARERYLGEIARVDAAIGDLLAAIPERTIVVVAGDHGESLGEHGEETHGHLVYGATMDVPLLLAGPGVPPGKRTGSAASLADIAPTLRRLCGLAARESDGTDLLGSCGPRVLCGESLYAWRLYGWAQQSVATDGRFTLVDGGPRLELFDRAGDAGELAPLADPRAGEAYERLDRALQHYRRAGRFVGGAPADVATPYGTERREGAAFLDAAANGALRDVGVALGGLKTLYALQRAIEGREGGLVRTLLPEVERLEAADPSNPALPLHRGRALLLLGSPREAAAALEGAWRRGYRSEGVLTLRVRALHEAGDLEGAERAVAVAEIDREVKSRLLAEIAKLRAQGEKPGR